MTEVRRMACGSTMSRLFVCIFVLALGIPGFGKPKPKTLFYYVPNEEAWASLLRHADRISTLAPQVFFLDENGEIRGAIEERVLALGRQHGIEIVPLLANDKPEAAHNVLINRELRRQVIENALRLCLNAGCTGLQLDIEGVGQEDGPAFTEFVRESSEAFHAQQLELSVALPTPLLTPDPGKQYPETFAGFVVFREPYDMAQIAPLVDFVSLMTYGQYGIGTGAGPVASYAWVEQSVRYALQFIPRQKLSMGLGLWSQRWCNHQVTFSSHAEAEELRKKHGAATRWNKEKQSSSFTYDDANQCPTSVWMETRRSLRARMQLVRKYGLRGFSAWRLGHEDGEFWRDMPVRSKGQTQP